MADAGIRGRLLVPMLALLLVTPILAWEGSPVRASLAAERASVVPGEAFSLDIVLDIEPGWHVYGPPPLAEPEGTGLPTTVEWELPPGFSALPLEWPETRTFTIAGLESEGYSGRLSLRSRIIAPKTIAIGEIISIKARVEWLACRTECMPGGASLGLSLPVAAAPPGGSPETLGLALALVLAFAGGLILNLMPCVLPVLSLKTLSLAKRAGDGRGALAQGLFFTAGVLVSFWLIAGILLVLREGGRAAGWGFQLQDPAFVAAAAMVFFLMGLSLFGVFELGASLTRLGGTGAGGAAASAFLGGMLTTAVATPCTAPFMGVAVGYALSHNAIAALGVFTALGLGMATPLLAISAMPGLARRLPKPGPWMERFRQALGFPMMAAAIWMAFVLSSLGGAAAVIGLLEGLLAVAVGAWAWGTWGRMDRTARARIVAAAIATALVAGGAAWSMRGALMGADALMGAGIPFASAPTRTRTPAITRAEAFWRPWSEDALAELRRRGTPVFVDFTAAWCLSCQVNEAIALDSAAVRARFAELGVAALKADWTARDEAIGRALASLGRASVPVYALYAPGASGPVLLPEILTPAIVLQYLDETLARKR